MGEHSIDDDINHSYKQKSYIILGIIDKTWKFLFVVTK